MPVGPDGHAELTAPPVTQLLRHLPLQLGLLPHLVPQSINMWMGAAPDGEQGPARRPGRILPSLGPLAAARGACLRARLLVLLQPALLQAEASTLRSPGRRHQT